ncbi:MAG: hypothetical protein R3B90_02185 [Planctomycetaceae bacterium]
MQILLWEGDFDSFLGELAQRFAQVVNGVEAVACVRQGTPGR